MELRLKKAQRPFDMFSSTDLQHGLRHLACDCVTMVDSTSYFDGVRREGAHGKFSSTEKGLYAISLYLCGIRKVTSSTNIISMCRRTNVQTVDAQTLT